MAFRKNGKTDRQSLESAFSGNEVVLTTPTLSTPFAAAVEAAHLRASVPSTTAGVKMRAGHTGSRVRGASEGKAAPGGRDSWSRRGLAEVYATLAYVGGHIEVRRGQTTSLFRERLEPQRRTFLPDINGGGPRNGSCAANAGCAPAKHQRSTSVCMAGQVGRPSSNYFDRTPFEVCDLLPRSSAKQIAGDGRDGGVAGGCHGGKDTITNLKGKDSIFESSRAVNKSGAVPLPAEHQHRVIGTRNSLGGKTPVRPRGPRVSSGGRGRAAQREQQGRRSHKGTSTLMAGVRRSDGDEERGQGDAHDEVLRDCVVVFGNPSHRAWYDNDVKTSHARQSPSVARRRNSLLNDGITHSKINTRFGVSRELDVPSGRLAGQGSITKSTSPAPDHFDVERRSGDHAFNGDTHNLLAMSVDRTGTGNKNGGFTTLNEVIATGSTAYGEASTEVSGKHASAATFRPEAAICGKTTEAPPGLPTRRLEVSQSPTQGQNRFSGVAPYPEVGPRTPSTKVAETQRVGLRTSAKHADLRDAAVDFPTNGKEKDVEERNRHVAAATMTSHLWANPSANVAKADEERDTNADGATPVAGTAVTEAAPPAISCTASEEARSLSTSTKNFFSHLWSRPSFKSVSTFASGGGSSSEKRTQTNCREQEARAPSIVKHDRQYHQQSRQHLGNRKSEARTAEGNSSTRQLICGARGSTVSVGQPSTTPGPRSSIRLGQQSSPSACLKTAGALGLSENVGGQRRTQRYSQRMSSLSRQSVFLKPGLMQKEGSTPARIDKSEVDKQVSFMAEDTLVDSDVSADDDGTEEQI